MSFLFRRTLKVSFGKQFPKIYCLQGQRLQLQSLKTTSVILGLHKQNPNTTPHNENSNTTKKHKETPKITLIQNQNITVTALEDAKNLAKRRAMNLVKVEDLDPKTQRPVYKLLTSAEMLEYELSDKKKSDKSAAASDKSSTVVSKKTEKSLNIGSRIAEHDLSSRLKNILKWLNKQHEVRIIIQGSSVNDLSNCEKIFKTIEEAVKTPQVIGRVVQKRSKGNIIKFYILPVTATINDESTSEAQ